MAGEPSKGTKGKKNRGHQETCDGNREQVQGTGGKEGTDEGDLAELDARHWDRLEEIKITVDSGAVDTVGPPETAPAMTM